VVRWGILLLVGVGDRGGGVGGGHGLGGEPARDVFQTNIDKWVGKRGFVSKKMPGP